VTHNVIYKTRSTVHNNIAQPSGDPATATGNNAQKYFVKFGRTFLRYARGETHRQTDRHTDRNTSPTYRGGKLQVALSTLDIPFTCTDEKGSIGEG